MGGGFDDISTLTQQVTVPASGNTLSFYYVIGSEDACGYDYAYVRINGTTVVQYELCSDNNTAGWVEGLINLSAYAGQSVSLQFYAQTDGSLNSNFFLDDVSFK
jgi:bacillopeptidase F (M6 metalloprotease family)